MDILSLEKKAWEIRYKLLKMFSYEKTHHFGGSFSCVEILTALYFYKMNYNKENMFDKNRDRLIMSKGHSVPTQYVILSMLGIIPEKELSTIKKLGSMLQGHPDVDKTPGLEAPTGSLGQGLSYSNGIAIAAKLDGLNFKVYVVLGDGELHEGQIWEAAMTSSHYKLDNIVSVVDRNLYQSQGFVDNLKRIEPVSEKFKAFGWEVFEVDGHSIKELTNALDEADKIKEKPTVIIANTVKGKGISIIENTYKFHNYKLTKEEYDKAEKEILEKLNSFDKKNLKE